MTPTIVLVHGSWHGSWCWNHLAPRLDERGLRSVVLDLPSCGPDPRKLGTVADDAAALETVLADVDGDAIVVAHSYGGVVATQADLGSRVRHILYLGAFMPDLGQALADLLPPGPLPPFVVDNGDGSTSVDPALAIDTFYADCDPAIASWAAGRLGLHHGVNNVTPVTRCSWRDVESTYVVLQQDHASPPPMQEALAAQAGARRDLDSSHSPFLSMPADLADLIAEVAG